MKPSLYARVLIIAGLLCLIGATVLILPVSADTVCPWAGCGTGVGWYEEFNTSATENQTYWGGNNATYFTDITKSIIYTTDDGSQITYLGNISLTNGTFYWNVRYINLTTSEAYPEMIFGAQEVSTGESPGNSPSITGNKYVIEMYAEPSWMYLYLWRVALGSRTVLKEVKSSWYNNTWYNISVEWWPYNTTPIIIKKDGVYLTSSTDTTYISGRAGMGQYAYWPNRIEWNNVSFTYNPTTTGNPTVADSTFACSPVAGVRSSSRACVNSSQSDTIDYYGAGRNPCIGTNTTTPNPQIFPKNFSWCGICMIAAIPGSASNTSCTNLYVSQPWVG